MGKKNKFLSWLGFGKSDKEQQEAERQEQLAKEQAEREEAELQAQLAKEQAEREEAAHQEQLAKEQAEREEAERQAQLAKEQTEREEAERQAQLAKEQAEREEAERQAQQAKEQAEREEAELQVQLAKEQAEREEAERQAQQAKEQAEREEAARQEQLAKEQAEREEAERQAQLAKEQAEREEAERQAQLAKEQAEREEAERQAQLAKEQAEREEAERQAQLAKEQAEREEAEHQAQLAKEQAEREEAERQAQLAKEQAEREESERQAQLAKERAEREEEERQAQLAQEQEKPKKEGFFSRLKKGLLKTKANIGSGFASVFKGKKIDDELFEDLETQLLTADIGVETTMKLIDNLTDAADRKQLKDGEALYDLMKKEMSEILKTAEQPLEIPTDKKPFVILMVGVNGVGKTTTIGKLAKQFQSEGKSVMLAAGDTFRAAAVEQLQVWGERNSIPVVAQHTGADSASVVFDAFQAAKARNIDVLIADTAGRLQNKDNLMQELEKIARVMKKLDPDAPHEVMLTIDAGTGQNAISQVKLFNQAVGLTGITLTKLDGTAKGGVIFAVADQFKVPIRYIGVGEGIDDLRTFKSDDFIEALFSQE
ncbi:MULTISPECIES: signal recognition particle-docking protein FtsY [unclassified Pseudoalteromonas]|uniref:signal recognition particle-docking protein FtsY n=1 Tax=unclassified Pseudoalteromonas TaxID=194690 RepID=UPI001F1990E8|nr:MULTISPECIES: signal recognition particle-docking protein FtsY [unclassified Pseudoalteromonas]MCF2827367.1 signal recognition particle-docking protein FtsY [Pseudoalteromonas sp. OF5H-5]MCF2831018.1 signal recognition particle-docking protein FtsY [Pseudoalteromonas sp. DL2-H6]MCF2923412.1 signal recognition particle-docking protein FtsY [Pseudoalteromonas sp. DL2-H1]